MHISHAFIGQIAGAIALISFVPYIISIFRYKTKPHRSSFAIWSLVGIVTIASYIAGGAHTAIWVGLVYAFFGTVVFLLSLKYGVGGFSKLDIACMLGAVFGIVLWISTKDPKTALYTGIAVEVLGQIPTWRKSYLQPDTEDTFSWGMDSFAALLNLFAITSLKPQILVYPVWGGAW